MGKLKKLSTEIVALLFIEPMSFNQITRELEEETIGNIIDTIDVLTDSGLLIQIGNQYSVTNKTSEFFSCWP